MKRETRKAALVRLQPENERLASEVSRLQAVVVRLAEHLWYCAGEMYMIDVIERPEFVRDRRPDGVASEVIGSVLVEDVRWSPGRGW